MTGSDRPLEYADDKEKLTHKTWLFYEAMSFLEQNVCISQLFQETDLSCSTLANGKTA